ncbi:hypothetical protein BU25DRAFT_415928 [Macroventuria anomochaeta]|uniref:Uncharacterized protein n=1 Tax=Macroventuria anomochaeta TaxID=301207 RepID=A0ACB6RJ14_9PLEO|nr:uncharacterized protein BU25DRAFT_415928 [Macroventuria anomochaeta]KAF2621733.1 hypothetical protein BU25DRAFT_415928 [Macroventuria anomochaeta]
MSRDRLVVWLSVVSPSKGCEGAVESHHSLTISSLACRSPRQITVTLVMLSVVSSTPSNDPLAKTPYLLATLRASSDIAGSGDTAASECNYTLARSCNTVSTSLQTVVCSPTCSIR